jgi:hypothetical protein
VEAHNACGYRPARTRSKHSGVRDQCPLSGLWVISAQSDPGLKFGFVRSCPQADKGGCGRIVRFVPKADKHGWFESSCNRDSGKRNPGRTRPFPRCAGQSRSAAVASRLAYLCNVLAVSDFVVIIFKTEQHVSIFETVTFVAEGFNPELSGRLKCLHTWSAYDCCLLST